MDAQPPQDNGSSQQPDKDQPAQPARSPDDATMRDSQPAHSTLPNEPEEDPLPDEILNASADDIMARTRLIDNDLKVMRSETMRLNHERNKMKEQIKDNTDKIKNNKMLPYLVGNVVEASRAPLFSLVGLVGGGGFLARGSETSWTGWDGRCGVVEEFGVSGLGEIPEGVGEKEAGGSWREGSGQSRFFDCDRDVAAPRPRGGRPLAREGE
ncbi:26S proteasome regulatory subunit 6A [Rhodotorula toruloides]